MKNLFIVIFAFIISVPVSLNAQNIADYTSYNSSSKIRMIPQLGHSDTINDCVFSPDRRFVVSTGQSTLVWDFVAGKIIHNIDMEGYKVFFSADQKYFTVVNSDRIACFEFPSYRKVSELAFSALVYDIKITSADGRRILMKSNGGYYAMIDCVKGSVAGKFKPERTVNHVSATTDLSLVAFSQTGSPFFAEIVDMVKGRLLQTLKSEGFNIKQAYLSDDGRNCVTIGFNSVNLGEMKIFDTGSGKLLSEIIFAAEKIAGFSSDGKRFYTWGSAGQKKPEEFRYFTEWNIQNGMKVRTITGNYFNTSQYYHLTAILDGKVVSSNFDNSKLTLDGKYILSYDGFVPELALVETNKPIRSLTAEPIFASGKIVVGKKNIIYSASAYPQATVNLWDGRSMKLLKSILVSKISGAFTDFCLSQDEKQCCISTTPGEIFVTDIASGKTVEMNNPFTEERINDGRIWSVAFTPDNRGILAAVSSEKIALFDIESGKMKELISSDGAYSSISPLDGNRYLADNRVIDIRSKEVVQTIPPPSGWYPSSSVVSDDGKRAICFFQEKKPDPVKNQICIKEIAGGKTLYTKGFTGNLLAVLNADGTLAAVTRSGSDVIEIVDVSSKKIQKRFNAEFDALSLQFSVDSRYLFASLKNGSIRMISLSNGASISVMSSGEEWIHYADDGYFDASSGGGRLVAACKGVESFGVDQLAVQFNRPDILYSRISLFPKDVIDHFVAQHQKRIKKLGLKDKTAAGTSLPKAKILSKETNGKFVNLNLSFTSESADIKNYNIFINDVPLYPLQGKSISGKKNTVQEHVELSEGENKIEVSCTNEFGIESLRDMVFEKKDPEKKGNLYFIAFGVSRYRDKELDLAFAEKDVKDLAEAFRSMKGKFDNVFIKTYTNEEVTAENIEASSGFTERASVDDTFILFIAGHGLHDTDKAATYYFLTHNADRNNIAETCADFSLFEKLLMETKSRKKLFLMDTCESGESEDGTLYDNAVNTGKGVSSRSARGFKISGKTGVRPYLYQKDRYIYNDITRRTGAIIFSSCRGGELSYESDKIENGFFTREMINALNGKDVRSNDGWIPLTEIRNSVIKSVPEATGNLQHPTVDRDNLFVKFSLPLLK